MQRKSTMKRVRKGKARPRESGYLVTWDVNSMDRAGVARLRRFVFGDSTRSGERVYRYPGFVERDGVRYLGQSVLFVRPHLLKEIEDQLAALGVDHETTAAVLG